MVPFSRTFPHHAGFPNENTHCQGPILNVVGTIGKVVQGFLELEQKELWP